MNSVHTLTNSGINRFGFHYYPDSLHYRESDLQSWLPELKALGAAWLVLQAPAERAIPEEFISGLCQARVEPVIQFPFSLEQPPDVDELALLLEAYSHWGVKYVQFFDRPNTRAAWPASGWAQQDLVERFLDRWTPLAVLALRCGMTPFFPALEPGGNYWDTAFLRAALQSLERRKHTNLLQDLVLSAYAWSGEHSLNWGAGGPEAWPEAHPYHTPANSQDQRGFRGHEWYQTVARAAVEKSFPIFLLQAGQCGHPAALSTSRLSAEDHRDTALAIARLMAGEDASDPQDPQNQLEPISPQVMGCAFWLLAAEPGSPGYPDAWFREDGQNLPAVEALKTWVAQPRQAATLKRRGKGGVALADAHPIKHYLLLPTYEWGVADWHLEVIRPFVKKYQPTVGFSVEEAALAESVTVIGNFLSFSEDVLDQLRARGCAVERISGDGTSIATQLAER